MKGLGFCVHKKKHKREINFYTWFCDRTKTYFSTNEGKRSEETPKYIQPASPAVPHYINVIIFASRMAGVVPSKEQNNLSESNEPYTWCIPVNWLERNSKWYFKNELIHSLPDLMSLFCSFSTEYIFCVWPREIMLYTTSKEECMRQLVNIHNAKVRDRYYQNIVKLGSLINYKKHLRIWDVSGVSIHFDYQSC